ncbi:heme-binding domain-containing protein [Halpernia frigidisoli]|uniref:Haem-binding domain-containing protein n=1 Tax=Halpernia frigidisoli TaxID=1125876 RepID=A0A1I3G0Y9_9FLAO|nr:heme-binding domain-containing protein [Halpernia frigidisoli]SFI16972.1 Haem-binding domain-containing protein [Halpernia frigidisoli]
MKKILIVLLLAFVIIQFFPIDKTNPPVNNGTDFLVVKNTPENVAKIIKTSCYDCHSNESKYPWYSSIQPSAWFLKDHIEEGRKHLNFSNFATYTVKQQSRKLEEAAEEIQGGDMPLSSYTMIHGDANMTAEQKVLVINYFKEMSNDIRILNNLPADQVKVKK